MPVVNLPWWAKVLLPIVVKLLVGLLRPFLDEQVGKEMATTIINFILHIVGADNQMQEVVRVQEAHRSCGIAGCAPMVKSLD